MSKFHDDLKKVKAGHICWFKDNNGDKQRGKVRRVGVDHIMVCMNILYGRMIRVDAGNYVDSGDLR